MVYLNFFHSPLHYALSFDYLILYWLQAIEWVKKKPSSILLIDFTSCIPFKDKEKRYPKTIASSVLLLKEYLQVLSPWKEIYENNSTEVKTVQLNVYK